MEHPFSQPSSESMHPDRSIERRRNFVKTTTLPDHVLSERGTSAVLTQVQVGETADAVTQPKPKRKYKPRARKCACGCGEVFTPKLRRGKYLNAVHRQRAYVRKQRKGHKIAPRQQSRAPGVCAYCGNLCWVNPDRGQLYCSAKCRNGAYKAKRTASVNALAQATSIDTDHVWIAYESGGLRWIVSMLTQLGLQYSPESRQWFVAVDVQTFTGK